MGTLDQPAEARGARSGDGPNAVRLQAVAITSWSGVHASCVWAWQQCACKHPP